MSDQLYRLNPLDSLDKPILRHMIRAVVLVPVEPDYEAAARYIALQLDISNEAEYGQEYSDAYAVALDVDAALKGTDEW